jgi:hypothetical protein
MVLANGHNARWPLTVCTAGGPGRTHGRGRLRPRPHRGPDQRPGPHRGRAHRRDRRRPHERTPDRLTNPTGIGPGAGDHDWGSGAADPKLRAGSFFPSLLKRRRRVDQMLFAVVMEADLHRPRPGGGRLRHLRHPGAGRPELPRCVRGCRRRQGPGQPPGRRPGGVVATGVCGDGRREVLGFAVGDSEDGAIWTQFLRSLKASGLAGVQLVIADAHLALRQARQRGHGWGGGPALPGPLPQKRPRPGAQGLSRDGGRGHPHDLRPARRHPRP